MLNAEIIMEIDDVIVFPIIVLSFPIYTVFARFFLHFPCDKIN